MTMTPKNSSLENTLSTVPWAEDSSLRLLSSLSVPYEISSCLKYSDQSATYLLRQKDTGKIALLKFSSNSLYAKSLLNEKTLLDFIHHESHPAVSAFPTVLELNEFEHVHYLIRSYIPGKTLEEICESGFKKPGIPKNQTLNYMIQLTELLDFLHTRILPIIHRDIKPQNVVIDPEGGCHLIDFGISRYFDGTKGSDTQIMGTRATAPPEQYGYQETDTRSDLYSMGVLLHYCITGEYEITEQSLSDLPPEISRIVQKATMFDPDKRYQSAKELLSDLLSARYETPYKSDNIQRSVRFPWYVRILAGLLAANLFLTGGLLYNKFRRVAATASPANESVTTSSSETAVSPVYTFKEPLIEQAVRKILHKEYDPVTEADLKKITELRIMGLQVYSKENDFWIKGSWVYPWNHDYMASELHLQRGTISSLEDISHMPNLVLLNLYRQQISDISLLKDTTIEALGLGMNPLTDLSPLRDNPSIRSLSLAALEITDTDVIATLPNLQSLDIGGTGITSLAGLENCPLESLNLDYTNIDYDEDFTRLSSLSWLELTYITRGRLSSLSTLPLKTLRIIECSNLSLDDLSVLPELETVYCRFHEMTDMQITAPNLPNLRELDLVNVRIKNFEPLSSLSELTTLYIYGIECESYDGLDKLPKLSIIGCNDDQREALMTLYPDKNIYT